VEITVRVEKLILWNAQKFHRVRMPYKRSVEVAETFSILKLVLVSEISSFSTPTDDIANIAKPSGFRLQIQLGSCHSTLE
jgi:hypothetical protein